MPEEQMKSFLVKVQSNTELQEKIEKAVSIEAVIEIAGEAGFSITADDIKSEVEGELSLDELGAVAGGWTIPVADDNFTAKLSLLVSRWGKSNHFKAMDVGDVRGASYSNAGIPTDTTID